MREYFLPRLTVIFVGSIVLSSCNMTTSMNVQKAATVEVVSVTQPISKQASFALSKVVANLKRGTTIAHFPGGGVEGVEGTLCNRSYGENATIEWGAGSSVLGNWSTELGEIFHEVLSQKGLKIAGDPKDLFGQQEAVSSSEYLIGARITDLKGNFCHAHHWWDGRPLNTYSGEMSVAVEWTVFSSLLQREVLKASTQGYFKQKQPKRDGIMLAFQNAFAHATENLMGSEKLINVALRKRGDEEAGVSDPVLNIVSKELSKQQADKNIDKILSAVVTIRLGLGHGTGFVIAENGLIITNAHVVGTSKKVSVILNNGLELVGEVLRVNDQRDVALIKVPVRVPSALPLRVEKPSTLEKVYVIGTPIKEGLRSTVTQGVVSALRDDENTGLDFIQSDAAISPGNSGGPLLDANGNVVGISVLKIVGKASEGLNMFIPIDSALKALNIKHTSRGS